MDISKQVLENYFGVEVEENRGEEYKLNGRWYHVQPAEYVENLSDDDELGWVKSEPKYFFENKYYYIIEQ